MERRGVLFLQRWGGYCIPRPLKQKPSTPPSPKNFQSAISEESAIQPPHTLSPNPPYSSKQGDGFSLKRGWKGGGGGKAKNSPIHTPPEPFFSTSPSIHNSYTKPLVFIPSASQSPNYNKPQLDISRNNPPPLPLGEAYLVFFTPPEYFPSLGHLFGHLQHDMLIFQERNQRLIRECV